MKINNFSNFIKNSPSLSLTIVTFLLMLFFISLDYYTFIEIFHFDSASFIDIYFNSLNLASQSIGLLTVLFPFIILFIFFYMLIINTKILERYISDTKRDTSLQYIFLSALITALTLFTTAYLFFSLLNNYPFIVLYFIFILAPTITSFIISILLKKINIFYIIKNNFLPFVSIFGVLYLSLILIVYKCYPNIDEFYIAYSIFIFIIEAISIFMFSIKINDNTNDTSNKKTNYIKYFYFFLLSIFIIIAYLHYLNTTLWNNTKIEKTNFSFNLYLNKLFLSDNHDIIDINATYYNKNNELLKYINTSQNCWNDITKKVHIDSNNTSYLPISKEIKLYFQKKDENLTCIYAINKDLFENKYNYTLEGIGYLNNTKGTK